MNIGSLFRGMMGDVKPGEAKQMELKEGQVVRGIVSSVSDDGQEAVIQIQGVKVRAKLETPLQQGETTMLQVQPPGKDGMPVLKPVAGTQTAPLPAASMGELLESFSLPDTKDNRAMINQMRTSGIPLTADNVKNIQTSLAQKPASVPVGEWVQAAAVAVQKGLPVTGQSIAGLHQALFGPPLHEMLGNMEQLLQSAESQLKGGTLPQASTGNGPAANPASTPSGAAPSSVSQSTASNNAGTNSAPTGLGTQTAAQASNAGNPTAVLLNKLQNVLQQINSLVPQTVEQDMPLQNAAASTQTALSEGEAETVPQTSAVTQNKAEPEVPGTHTGTMPTQATSTQAKLQTAPWVGQILKLLGAEYEQQTVRAALTLTAGATAASTESQGGASLSSNMPANAAQLGRSPLPVNTGSPIPGTMGNAAAPLPTGTTSANVQSPIPTAPTIPELPDAPAAPQSPTVNSPSVPAAPTSAQHSHTMHVQDRMLLASDITQPDVSQIAQPAIQSAEDTLAKAQDTLKGLLLQLTAADDVPPVLKDAAQQLIQQLTGQQLLLNTDRTAPFAQVTMFVPFNGPDGQETASVQIQSRRGAKGELDASNCRLWFDLDMKMLGPTLLDVHVVDKIVTLKVHNDLEQLAPLIESKKKEVADAIGSLGYQLLSLQFAGLPVRSAGEVNGMTAPGSGLLDQYAPPEYKGVDMKI
ncbi:hypothetical protein [Paenibacillus shenyangensis]|uniref:hypothetical protein n=1 Tax=Paenibacillus sp. A9 TaxID=1284352 RepID=UPI00035F651D|nr:hypothetical protein [Paenibacillus sp. A9]